LTKTLVLSQPPGQSFPDTLVVRRRLNTGETLDMFSRIRLAGGLPYRGLAICSAYLLDWSLLDDNGQKVHIAGESVETIEAVLKALTFDAFAEIRDAIDAHIVAMDAEREAEKNGRDGATELPAISPSPSAAAGATNGSSSSTLM